MTCGFDVGHDHEKYRHRHPPPDRWPASAYSRARQCWLGQPRLTSQIGISRRRHEASPTKSNRVIPVIRNSSLTAGLGGVPCVRSTRIPVAVIYSEKNSQPPTYSPLSATRARRRPRLPAIRGRQRTDPPAAAALFRQLSVQVLTELPVRPRDTQRLRRAPLSPLARRHLEHMTTPLTPIGAVPGVPPGAKTRLPTNFHKTAGAVDIDVATRAALRPLLGH